MGNAYLNIQQHYNNHTNKQKPHLKKKINNSAILYFSHENGSLIYLVGWDQNVVLQPPTRKHCFLWLQLPAYHFVSSSVDWGLNLLSGIQICCSLLQISDLMWADITTVKQRVHILILTFSLLRLYYIWDCQ